MNDLYDLSDINKAGAPLVYQGIGTASTRANPQYAAFNTRGNRGRSAPGQCSLLQQHGNRSCYMLTDHVVSAGI